MKIFTDIKLATLLRQLKFTELNNNKVLMVFKNLMIDGINFSECAINEIAKVKFQ